MKGNIFLDGGSDTSYITQKAAEALGLPITSTSHVAIDIFGGNTEEGKYPKTQVRLSSRRGQALVDCYITEEITKPINMADWKEAGELFPDWSFPQLEGDSFPVDILIGMDFINDIRGNEIRKVGRLEARNSILGPYLEGNITGNVTRNHNEESATTLVGTTTKPTKDYHYSMGDEEMAGSFDFDKAETMLEQFFSEEDFSATQDKDPTKHELLQKLKEGIRLVDTPTGRNYEVPMLWKSKNSKEKLKPNFGLSLAFLHKLVDRLEESGKLESANTVIEAAIASGFYEEVETDHSLGHHIPTFFVSQPHSTSTPMRHVIAGNLGKPCINSELEKGPSLIADLPTLLRQFRAHEIGITGDISKAFHQLVVRPEDRDMMRFLWFRKGSRTQLITLRLARVPFGTCLAPFQLFGTLFLHLQNHQHPTAKDTINKLYSDNLVTSVKENALEFILDTVKILNDGGFTLKKFSSNSKALAQELEARDLLNVSEKEVTRVLGMSWDLFADSLQFCKPSAKRDEKMKVCRRSILQTLPRHYDPLGILAPVLMPGVAFLSELCERQYGWDEELSKEDLARWTDIYSEIKICTEDLKIPRHHNFDPDKPVRLHVLADASTAWGGCAAYLTQNGKAALVAAKAKLPAKRLRDNNITVPRRELEALVMAAKMMARLLLTYEPIYKQVEPHLFSDSQIVLNWVANAGKVDAFVDNRVRLIKELVPQVPLTYIDTNDNSADAVSRGMKSSEYLDPNHLLWTGPPLLHEPEIPVFKPPKKETVEALTLVSKAEDPTPSVLNLVGKCSTMAKLKRTLATLITCARKWQKKTPLDGAKLSRMVATSILKAEQEATSGDIIAYLKTKKGPRPQSIHPHQLFLDSAGLIRCGGRLGNSSMSYSSRYPIYYPNNSPLIKQRVLEMHETAKHAGPGVTRAKILQMLWIPRSSNTIKRILKDCYNCKRATGPAFKWPKSPDLPASRTKPEAYDVIGCDLTGAFIVRNKEDLQKVYVALFTDCGTRHISVQVMDNMETTTFMQAFRRHCSIYGVPSKVISDQGTYFVKASGILEDKLNEEEIGQAMNRKGISWQFNPAGAPHFGAHYERLIGTLKGPLKRTIGRKILDKQEFITLVMEATAVVNDRPLTTTNPTNLQDRLEGAQMLTPNHLVFGRTTSPMPYGEGQLEDEEDPTFIPDEEEISKQWRRLATRLNNFKQQFYEEYLAYLRTKHNIDHHSDPIDVPTIGKGDLVIMKSDTEKRSLWDMAEVIEILPSSDSRTRAVRLRTKHGETSRPIIKLFPLLSSRELRPDLPTAEAANAGDTNDAANTADTSNAVETANADNSADNADDTTEGAEAGNNHMAGATPTAQPSPSPPTPRAAPTQTRPRRAAGVAGRERVQTWCRGILED